MASATLVQDCFELVHKEYSLPEESRTGPVLAEDTPVTEGSFTDNVSQGEAPVELRQLDSPYPEQCKYFLLLFSYIVLLKDSCAIYRLEWRKWISEHILRIFANKHAKRTRHNLEVYERIPR